MALRRVTNAKKDSNGIIAIGGHWIPRSRSLVWIRKETAINHIDQGTHAYFIRIGQLEVDIEVVDGWNGPYLRTHRDQTERNNLLDLPD